MALSDLNEQEIQVVLECLKAAVEGPFFPEGEFPTLFGIHRNEVQAVIDNWLVLDENSQEVTIAINNSLNNLLGYPHGRQDVWNDYISVGRNELGQIFNKWRQESIESHFHGMM